MRQSQRYLGSTVELSLRSLAVAGFLFALGSLAPLADEVPAPVSVLGTGEVTAQEAPPPSTMAGRSTVYAPNAAIATSQPLATSAGLAVLERGGNAIDAAVTAAITLTVVEPHMTGLGGDLFALIWSAEEGELRGFSGHGKSGSLMTREAILEAGHESIPGRTAMAVTVPGSLRGWADLLEEYGTISLAEAMEPAVRLAEEGFPVSRIVSGDWEGAENALAENEGAREALLIDGERAPRPGEWFRNPDYAETLRLIQREGPGVFYGGELGERIVEGLQELGGFITLEDLANHESQWVDPISASFRDYRLWQIPPPGQGIAGLQMLRILEPLPLESMGHNSPEYLHYLVEAKKLAYADLARYIADPQHMDVNVEELLTDEYIAGRRELIDPHRAMEAVDPGPAVTESETIYLSAADADGNMVSFINSVFSSFGSAVVVPGTGFALHNRGSGFTMEPDMPNTVGPNKEPFHTIIPGFVTKTSEDGTEEPWLSYGVMSGAMQPQGQVQVLLNLVLFDMDVQEAIDAARFRHFSGMNVGLEPPIAHEIREALRARGHEVSVAGPFSVGGGQAVLRLEQGWAAGSDPRKDGQAAGF